ncbi:MAG TPA: isoaspartyl peptidase/L-asparaginase family protein [Candidatus Dormibacteraeota bacterium]|jgi:beta-aspartyl-peptidase (threonine type)|nr:isoaspartyl peptidase/L-asparaginase family protein [Candidatus Dormibacteraeota bacterium]
MAQLVLHGGAGGAIADRPQRQAAVDRALDAGWAVIGESALAAVQAAVRQMEDEPLLNAGVGAALTQDGTIELDASIMDGTELRSGAVAGVRDLRHPVDAARAVLDDGRHLLLIGEGASRLAAAAGVARCEPGTFATDRQVKRWEAADTVGAVARDDGGRLAVAVSTGGVAGKLPGRVGDSPLIGCGFYADDRLGAACATGVGENFMRLVLCHRAVLEMASMDAEAALSSAMDLLSSRLGATGGMVAIDRDGGMAARFTTPFMPWAQRSG